MIMHRRFHPNDDVDRLYIKVHGRCLISKEHCVRGGKNSLGLYVVTSVESVFIVFTYQEHFTQKPQTVKVNSSDRLLWNLRISG